MAQLIKTDGSIVNDVSVDTLQQQQQFSLVMWWLHINPS